MAEITAAKCQQVRDRTDCHMMVAKDALKETDGDVFYAVTWIMDPSSHERLRKLFSRSRKPKIKKHHDGKWYYYVNNCVNKHWIFKANEWVYEMNMKANRFHAFYYVQGEFSVVQ